MLGFLQDLSQVQTLSLSVSVVIMASTSKYSAILFLLVLNYYALVNGRTLEQRITLLEGRLDSLEEPSWLVLPTGAEHWDSCQMETPCDCVYLTKTVDCWGKLDPNRSRILTQMMVPRDARTMQVVIKY